MRIAVLALLLPAALCGQNKTPAPAVIPMPSNRAVDSYIIYSSLIPLGETANKDWPHDLWLVKDATITVVPPDQPCRPKPKTVNAARFDSTMNPHIAVHPPDDRKPDFAEILEDFDAHCHDSVALSPSPTLWQTGAPVHLLTPAEQQAFRDVRNTRAETPPKYKGAAALYSFSEVYFNARHTVALVYATHWCGGLCGQGMWIALALENGHWKQLHWNATFWIS
jgi:hypothetical protein